MPAYKMSVEEIKEFLKSPIPEDRAKGMHYCRLRNDISLDILYLGIMDQHSLVLKYALEACIERKDIPLEWIEKGLNHWSVAVWTAALALLRERKSEHIRIKLVEEE